MKLVGEEKGKQTHEAHAALIHLILQLDARNAPRERRALSLSSDDGEIVWLLGLSASENHRLNWILNGEQETVSNSESVH